MPEYRSRTTTAGRNMAGARALWRATGMKDDDFHKPIIAVANSFTQFVPGHVHLKDMGQLVAREIEKAGGVAKEFNTIAVLPKSSTPSPWTMASPWVMTACSVRCRAAISLLTASSTCVTPTAPMHWCASPTATKSPQEC